MRSDRFLYLLILLLHIMLSSHAQASAEPVLIPWNDGQGLWGYLDNAGNIKIKPRYTWAAPFVRKYAVVAKDGKYGVIDTTGKEVLPFLYQNIDLAAGAGYTIAITAMPYNAWWKLGRWRLWPGFSLSGSSQDKRLFDTRVIMLQWKLVQLETKSVFLSKTEENDGSDRGYNTRQLQFYGTQFQFRGVTYKVK